MTRYALGLETAWQAACGAGPQWPDVWLGTGNQREYEMAAELPCCRRCSLKLGDQAW